MPRIHVFGILLYSLVVAATPANALASETVSATDVKLVAANIAGSHGGLIVGTEDDRPSGQYGYLEFFNGEKLIMSCSVDFQTRSLGLTALFAPAALARNAMTLSNVHGKSVRDLLGSYVGVKSQLGLLLSVSGKQMVSRKGVVISDINPYNVAVGIDQSLIKLEVKAGPGAEGGHQGESLDDDYEGGLQAEKPCHLDAIIHLPNDLLTKIKGAFSAQVHEGHSKPNQSGAQPEPLLSGTQSAAPSAAQAK